MNEQDLQRRAALAVERQGPKNALLDRQIEVRIVEPGVWQAITMSAQRNLEWSTLIFQTLGGLITRETSPKQLMGLTGGVFNFCANLAGIVTPLVVGFVLGATGSFYGALAYIATLGLVGAAAYVFIVGEVKRVELSPV